MRTRKPRPRLPLVTSLLLAVLLPATIAGVSAHKVPTPPKPIAKPHFAPTQHTNLLSKQDRSIYRNAFAAAKKGKWSRARRFAARGTDPLPRKIIAWLYYVEPGSRPDFDEIAEFIGRNPHWPGQRSLLAHAEAAMGDSIPDSRVFAWFADRAPVSGEGRIRLGEALMRQGWPEVGADWIRYAWIGDNFGARRERAILKRHRKFISQIDHDVRLDRLLWDGRRGAARRMLRRVSAGHRKLAEARLRLMERAGGVDAAIDRVPAELKDHPGLVYERLRWRRRKGFDDRARELLLAPPDDVVRPNAWWAERAIQVRRALNDGHISDAYTLAGRHAELSGADFAEAEWIAGWIALRFLRDNEAAYRHFTRMYDAVRMPVSLARAAYWAGRASEAQQGAKLAREWYAIGAEHKTTFYGQLAAQRLEYSAILALGSDPAPTPAEAVAFEGREMVLAVRLLAELGEKKRLRPFIMALNSSAASRVEHAQIARLARGLGRTDLAVASAKRSGQAGFLVAQSAYPVITLMARGGAEPALLLAVSRQESAFNPRAISGSGARGLMQLMPATARVVAKRLKLGYTRSRLTDDPNYNTTLGSAFLSDLIDRYDGSYVLALAAYNAGPSRVRAWLRRYGDPRKDEVDVVDWIESVPFSETRNYVQRVLEGLQVYRLHLNGTTVTLRLDQDLRR